MQKKESGTPLSNGSHTQPLPAPKSHSPANQPGKQDSPPEKSPNFEKDSPTQQLPEPLKAPSEKSESPLSETKEENLSSPEKQRVPLENITPGTRVKNYLILRKIGEGKVGIVYEAEQVSMKRKVAIKFIRPQLLSNSNFMEDLKGALSLLSSIHRPQVIRIIDQGLISKCLFYVMPHHEGGTLNDWLKIRPALEEALPIVLKICEAVELVHSKGLIHGALKPSNIFITPDQEVILSDIGVPKYGLLFKSAFSAPELLQDSPQPALSSDIYSLGAIFYKMFSFSLQDGSKNLTALREILKKMMDPIPLRRYQNMEELRAAWDRLSQPGNENQDSSTIFLKPEEMVFMIVFAVMLFAVIGLILFLFLKFF